MEATLASGTIDEIRKIKKTMKKHGIIRLAILYADDGHVSVSMLERVKSVHSDMPYSELERLGNQLVESSDEIKDLGGGYHGEIVITVPQHSRLAVVKWDHTAYEMTSHDTSATYKI